MKRRAIDFRCLVAIASLAMPMSHAGAQQAPARQAITVEQVMQALEDQLKSISTKELKWKQTLMMPPRPAMADRFAERAKQLEASSPSNEMEAKTREMNIRDERNAEAQYRHASVSYSVWTLRYRDYTRFHGSNNRLKSDKVSSKTEYVGEASGQHRIIEHSNRTVDLTRKSNVLFNTLSACPPLVILHHLRGDGYPTEKVKAQIVSVDDAQVEVAFHLRNAQTLKAKFTLPHFSCTKVAILSSAGKELETMESSASWKNVPSLPFQPAVWTHTFIMGPPSGQRVWEFMDTKEVGPEGYLDFKEPVGYHIFDEEEGVP